MSMQYTLSARLLRSASDKIHTPAMGRVTKPVSAREASPEFKQREKDYENWKRVQGSLPIAERISFPRYIRFIEKQRRMGIK